MSNKASVSFIIEHNKDINKTIIKWIFKNKKMLTDKFKKEFPRSPFKYVIQFPHGKGTKLVDSDGIVSRTNNVAFLKWRIIKKMGCPVK